MSRKLSQKLHIVSVDESSSAHHDTVHSECQSSFAESASGRRNEIACGLGCSRDCVPGLVDTDLGCVRCLIGDVRDSMRHAVGDVMKTEVQVGVH